jgi:hypothetical protein
VNTNFDWMKQPQGWAMIDKDKEPWRELCEQAATEQDPKKLVKLLTKINQLFEAKRALKSDLPAKSA